MNYEANLSNTFRPFKAQIDQQQLAIEYIEENFSKKVKSLENDLEENSRKAKEFMTYIEKEYVLFYRNRKRIKIEIMEHSDTVNRKLQKLIADHINVTNKVNCFQDVLPIVMEA